MSTIVSIVLLLASVGLFFGYIDPTYSDIKELKIEQADYERALENSTQLQAERDKLLTKLNEMSATDLDRLQKLLPDNIDNVRLIIDIDNIASAYGMRIRNFKADAGGSEVPQTAGRDQNPVGTITLSFSTTATYNTFLAFIRDLEQSLRVIDVSSIQFASSDTNQLYDYSVAIKTYWLK
ncbi:MAG: type 4a pilus biogenesis protein PilO [Candidatus Paceibacterota bacterium]|jgi:Tfp pilus assembly protein PilO